MATLLDVSVLGYFSPIFTFLLVFVLLYGVLTKINPFGDQKGVYAILSLVAAVLVLIYPPAVQFINLFTPWLILLFIIIYSPKIFI